MDTSTLQVIGTPKRVILGSVENNGSPISPMANLKLLTKVATSLDGENSNVIIQPQSQPYTLMKTPVKYQRQLRSLGYICKKFLDIYKLDMEKGESKQISLGNLTVLLDVEKRRVYDIINIIASLRYASKVCKDKYNWYGNQYLLQTLTDLRSLAYSRNYHILLQKCVMHDLTFDDVEEVHMSSAPSTVTTSENDESQIFDDNRIGALCQKSMMLFLIAQGEPLNFKIISEIILSNGNKGVEDKTGIRRLYDISNVLEALGLIKRCDFKNIKKPRFIYSGPKLPSASNLDILQGFNNQLCDLEHLSDTSSDGSELKPYSILDFVDTEMRELDKSYQEFEEDKSPPVMMTAKKQLFPERNQNISIKFGSISSMHHHTPQVSSPQPSGFIKAPQSSFKFTPNGSIKIIKRDSNQNHIKRIDTNNTSKSYQRCNEFIRFSNKNVIRLNEQIKPLTFYKFSPSVNSSCIENGAVYKF